MTAKKKLKAKVKTLEAKVKTLKSKVDRAETTSARWQKRNKDNAATIASLQDRVAKRDRQLSKAKRAAHQPEAAPEDVAQDQPRSVPDESWTVAQLRAEARARGLTGLSGKTKAELLDTLA